MPIEIKVIPAKEQEIILNNKLDERTKYSTLTQKNNENAQANQQAVIELCKDKDSGFQFWCNNFCWIQDPEADKAELKEIPFLLYDYQEISAKEIIKAIEGGYDLPIEKSRKMGLSWLLMAILIWGWNFRKWECLVGSQKAENVDKRGNIKALLEKSRYILYRTPYWLIPKLKDKTHDKNMLLINPEHGSTIAGESNNTNFGRSDRRKVILFDEFASWEQTDKAAWQACGATTRCRIPLSTPNIRGTNCYYYQLVKDARKKNKPSLYLHWQLNPVFAKGLYFNELGEPRSPWYDNEVRRAADQQEVSQELDIDYEASMAGKVFGEFDYENQVIENFDYNPNLPLYVAWDFGLDQTAMLWIQPDKANKTINIIDEYVNDGNGQGDNIYHYLDILDSKEYKQAIHFGDPHSGENRSLTSGTSNAAILRRQGLTFKCQRAKIIHRVGSGRNLLGQVRISDKCILAIEMFSSWQMRKPKTGNTNSQIPDHGQYSHVGEAYTYFAHNYKNIPKSKRITKKNYSASSSGAMY